MKGKLPIWKENPGRFAHVSDAAEEILRDGPKLPRKSSNPCPLEGLAFAVSLDPAAWSHIAGLGEKVAVLDFDAPALDYYRWTKGRQLQEIPEVTKWGVENGWITVSNDVLVWYWDSESEEERFFRFDKGDEEVAYYREQLRLGREADEPVLRVEERPGWAFTPKMHRHVSRHYSAPDDACMEAELLNLWLAASHPEIGMVWYAETYDPVNLSAPRGAILPGHFGEVRAVAVASLEEWEREYSPAA